MRTFVASLADVAENLRSEYDKQDDGTFKLKIEGDIPEVAEYKATVKEFRDKNITLMKDAEEREKKLKAFDGVDLVEVKRAKAKLEALEAKKGGDQGDVAAQIRAAVAAETGPLKEQIATERTAREEAQVLLKKRELEGKLRDIASAIKVADKALPDFLSRGLRVFDLDGVAKEGETALYSTAKPTEPLSMKEWGELLIGDAPHLFEVSKGGGAAGRPGAHGRRTIDGSDPVELGRHMEAIAKGEIIVTG